MLPIEASIPELLRVLREGTAAVLQAPPGAGKTTRVPLALLNQPWLTGRIVMLEPRRLAARAAAGFMARQLGAEVGGTVGYRVRMDTRVSRRTRIEVVTEGVLTRMLHADPALEGISIVIFDEYHERNLHADLGLALTLQAQQLLRPDLRILVMSATLEGERVAALLGGAPILSSQGRAFPVATQYLERPVDGRIDGAVVRATLSAVADDAGDTLVFLPGAAEIERVKEALRPELPPSIDVYPLYGQLAVDVQDRAIAPSPPGRRKIVLATSIAETSLTIEGVRVVIDSGLMRVPRFSPRTGMTRLETIRVTRASADQRRGRAGRVAEGRCYRLWTEAEHTTLLAYGEPEILQADLAPLALDLAAWGIADPAELRWLDPPAPAGFGQARELLQELGAIGADGVISAHGRELAALSVHPRLAHMLLRGVQLGIARTAAELAALLGERDPLRDTPDPDVRLRLAALRNQRGDRGLLQRITSEARALLQQVRAPAGAANEELAGVLLACAYPDRIARLREGARGRYLMRNGRGATIDPAAGMADAEYVAIAQVDDRGAETRAFLAAPLERADLHRYFDDQLTTVRVAEWDAASHSARTRERVMLGAITVLERISPATAEETESAFRTLLRKNGLGALRWSESAKLLRARLEFLHHAAEGWPAVGDEALLDALNPANVSDLHGVLMNRLDWHQRARLEQLAPTHVTVPSGSHLPIDYSDPEAPALSARLQELFGWTDTPRIAEGRVPLTLHLLSPAHRPVQVTRDLASFWKSGYFEVRKDLKGRYPKHYWPDDPLTAVATRRARPRNQG